MARSPCAFAPLDVSELVAEVLRDLGTERLDLMPRAGRGPIVIVVSQAPLPQAAGLGFMVDLTCQHTNQTLLVEGPEITIRPVGTRRVMAGSR